jgi:D-serine deaminase-like pyridoxal phosphate-dependent protein
MLVRDLDTPSVIVDMDVMGKNTVRMAEYCRAHNIGLRPHIKTHKIPQIARLQMENGAIGVTAAKLGEAELMADSGVEDILIAYPIIGAQKTTRLAALAGRTRITVAVDSPEAITGISESAVRNGVNVGVLVELDVGMRRCGVEDESAAILLAQMIRTLPGLTFRGLMFYPGHLLTCKDDRQIQRDRVIAKLQKARIAFEREGIPLAVISGGSTPTAYESHLFKGVTEIRPGMYPFNDCNLIGAGVTTVDDCALAVMVTVVSTAVPGRVIIDGGSKTFSSDRLLTADGVGFGLVKEDPLAIFESMSEEHGHLDVSRSARPYRIGERLRIIPNHVCATINMHDRIYGMRSGMVEVEWPVAARGKVT